MVDPEENLFQCMARMLAAGTDPVARQEEIWARYGEEVAILVMDSSGFSRVSASHGIVHFLAQLMRLRQLCEPELQRHHCKLLNFEADNAFAAFPRAQDAIAAALGIQRAVHDADLRLTASERYRVSLGIGYGPLLYSETLEGYFGDEMNCASKLGEDIANGDQVLVTEAAFNAAGRPREPAFEAAQIEISGISMNYYRHQFSP